MLGEADSHGQTPRHEGRQLVPPGRRASPHASWIRYSVRANCAERLRGRSREAHGRRVVRERHADRCRVRDRCRSWIHGDPQSGVHPAPSRKAVWGASVKRSQASCGCSARLRCLAAVAANGATAVPPAAWAVVALSILAWAVLIGTGGMLSAMASSPGAVRRLHKAAPYAAVLLTELWLCLR